MWLSNAGYMCSNQTIIIFNPAVNMHKCGINIELNTYLKTLLSQLSSRVLFTSNGRTYNSLNLVLNLSVPDLFLF